MTAGIRFFVLVCGIAVAVFALAKDAAQIPVDKRRQGILTEKPETKVGKVDKDRLVVHRIDVVDDDGTIRLTLASPTPPPIIDGIQYKRAFPASGITVFDKAGNERGGFGVADIDGSAVVTAQDHVNGDAIGWRIMPDGSISFVMNERGAIRREPDLGNHIVPATGNPTRIRLTVAADGTPAIALSDKEDHPRLQLTVNKEGFGAIEFLDARGNVVDSIVPEADSRRSRHR
ncbi:MAG TPA: hypothetical protein VHC92_13035 [Rhodanobacteraceae bacterium]|jgi:hypothetical protein|nr:hypothetical protein [Rhodanobacteraceae bacterium]